MNLADKVVNQIPMDSLWTDQFQLKAERMRYLNKEDIKKALKTGPVKFVVADVGHKLLWIQDSNNYAFWKKEAQAHIVENPEKFFLEDFPGEYAYLASHWQNELGAPIILLEKYH